MGIIGLIVVIILVILLLRLLAWRRNLETARFGGPFFVLPAEPEADGYRLSRNEGYFAGLAAALVLLGCGVASSPTSPPTPLGDRFSGTDGVRNGFADCNRPCPA